MPRMLRTAYVVEDEHELAGDQDREHEATPRRGRRADEALIDGQGHGTSRSVRNRTEQEGLVEVWRDQIKRR